jgi:hypothetical protein
MKTSILTAASAVFILGAARSDAALGLISAVDVPSSPFTVGQTFTISLSISGYTEATEIDAYAFQVTYPAALFNFVGSFDHGVSTPGPNQQWLSMANQETDGSYTPVATDNGSVDGVVVIDLADLGFTAVEGGTNSGSGFLVSFTMQAEAEGTGSFTPTAAPGGNVFFDTNFSPAGSPLFSGVSVTVVPEPGTLALSGLAALACFRRRRH